MLAFRSAAIVTCLAKCSDGQCVDSRCVVRQLDWPGARSAALCVVKLDVYVVGPHRCLGEVYVGAAWASLDRDRRDADAGWCGEAC